MTTISQILFSSSEITVAKPTGAKGGLKKIHPGQTVTAKVEKVITPQKIQLNIGGLTVTAKTHVPLMQGDLIQLKLTNDGEQHVFKLLPPLAPSVSQLYATLKAGIWETIETGGPYEGLAKALVRAIMSPKIQADMPSAKPGPLTEKLTDLLRSFATDSNTANPEGLRRMISGGGFTLENKLLRLLNLPPSLTHQTLNRILSEDVKALALTHLATTPNEDTESTNTLHSLLDGLEKYQILNRHTFDSAGKFFLPLPFLAEGQFRFGQLLIDLGKERDGEDAERPHMVKIAFLLEMTSIGKIRADVSILKKGIIGAFSVAHESIRAFIESHLDELKQRLNALDFQVLKLTCRLSPQEELTTASLADQLLSEEEGVLNVII